MAAAMNRDPDATWKLEYVLDAAEIFIHVMRMDLYYADLARYMHEGN